MSGLNTYFLSLLPGLGDLGSDPPMSMRGLLSQVGDAPGAGAMVEALALGDDLEQRESFMAGEIEQLDLAILAEEQARGQAPLPSEISGVKSAEHDAVAGVDAVWAGYYNYVMQVAKANSSDFLQAWVARQVTLRNSLAAARAKDLGLQVERYLVAEELTDSSFDFSGLVNEWSSAPTPLAGLQVIERSNWAWLVEHENWFSFDNDELAVYAAKLLALFRWQRIEEDNWPKAKTETANEA